MLRVTGLLQTVLVHYFTFIEACDVSYHVPFNLPPLFFMYVFTQNNSNCSQVRLYKLLSHNHCIHVHK